MQWLFGGYPCSRGALNSNWSCDVGIDRSSIQYILTPTQTRRIHKLAPDLLNPINVTVQRLFRTPNSMTNRELDEHQKTINVPSEKWINQIPKRLPICQPEYIATWSIPMGSICDHDRSIDSAGTNKNRVMTSIYQTEWITRMLKFRPLEDARQGGVLRNFWFR